MFHFEYLNNESLELIFKQDQNEKVYREKNRLFIQLIIKLESTNFLKNFYEFVLNLSNSSSKIQVNERNISPIIEGIQFQLNANILK